VISGKSGNDVKVGAYRAIFKANWSRGTWKMTRKYSLVIEGDSSGYSAYVPELPAILVTGASLEEIDSLATEAIRIYLENVQWDQPPVVMVHQIEVELPV
jgi:predicted RNase H-like HicB family nuclease